MGACELDFSNGPVQFEVEGLSMSPGIMPGDLLMIYPPSDPLRLKSVVVAYDPSRGLKVLKRVAGFSHDPNSNTFLVQLKSDHPDGRELTVKSRYILGQVQPS